MPSDLHRQELLAEIREVSGYCLSSPKVLGVNRSFEHADIDRRLNFSKLFLRTRNHCGGNSYVHVHGTFGAERC